MARRKPSAKKPDRSPLPSWGWVSTVTEKGSLSFSAKLNEMAAEVTFVADELHLTDIVNGKRLLFVQRHPISGEPTSSVEILLDTGSFRQFLESLLKVKTDDVEPVPYGSALGADLKIDRRLKATIAYFARNETGVCLEFFNISPKETSQAQEGFRARIEALLRVELLPGRAFALFEARETLFAEALAEDKSE